MALQLFGSSENFTAEDMKMFDGAGRIAAVAVPFIFWSATKVGSVAVNGIPTLSMPFHTIIWSLSVWNT